MGNVKSHHLKSSDKRASISSDHPSFYQRRWSSNNGQEERRKSSLEPNDIQSPVMDDSNNANGISENDNNRKIMTDAETYHRTLHCHHLKRPKSYPAVSSKPHPSQMQDFHTGPNSNSSENDISRRTQMHYLLKHYFGGKFKAPIQEILLQPTSLLCNHISKKDSNPIKILDICCGSGEWILEMATEYPNVQCYGINPSEAYPIMVKPSNAHFFCCDVAHNDTKLEFPANDFDFVRMEMIYKSYNKSQWKILVKELSRVLKPGGYFELRDIDPVMKHTGPLGKTFFEQYANLVKDKLDVDMDWYQHMCDYMKRYGGMIDIHFQKAMLPLGWGQGPVPEILLRFIKVGLQSHAQDWIDLSYESDKDDSFLNIDKTSQILDEAIEHHAYYDFYLCWGRKPYFTQTPMIANPVYESTPVKKDSDSEIWALVNGYDE